MMRIILFFLVFSGLAFAKDSDIWNAHPERGHTFDKRLKLVLSIIVDQKISILGSSFMALDEGFQETIYNNFLTSPEFINELLFFDKRAMESFKNFKTRFKILSFYSPDKNRAYRMSNEELVKRIMLLKEMTESIKGYYFDINDSLDDCIDRETQSFDHMIEEILSGDLGHIGISGIKVPTFILNLLSRGLTGKNAKDVLQEDILEIVSPGKDPTSSTDQTYNLEGTSVYLVKKLLERDKKLLKILMQIKDISSIPKDLTLDQFFMKKFRLTSLDAIRIINLANHNHGLEYFMTNAIMDLSTDKEQVISLVNNSMLGLNNLYKIIHEHESYREKISNLPQDQLDRKYHYWGGALVACELMDRDYNTILAKYISSKVGSAYESFGGKTLDQESKNDILLHDLGAEFATEVCK